MQLFRIFLQKRIFKEFLILANSNSLKKWLGEEEELVFILLLETHSYENSKH